MRRIFVSPEEQLLRLPSLVLRPRRPPRASPAASSPTVLRGLLRRETAEETRHRTPNFNLHQLTNDRDDTLLSRHPTTSLLTGPALSNTGPVRKCAGELPACATGSARSLADPASASRRER
jgi:hypothetical protein